VTSFFACQVEVIVLNVEHHREQLEEILTLVSFEKARLERRSVSDLFLFQKTAEKAFGLPAVTLSNTLP